MVDESDALEAAPDDEAGQCPQHSHITKQTPSPVAKARTKGFLLGITTRLLLVDFSKLE